MSSTTVNASQQRFQFAVKRLVTVIAAKVAQPSKVSKGKSTAGTTAATPYVLGSFQHRIRFKKPCQDVMERKGRFTDKPKLTLALCTLLTQVGFGLRSIDD